MKETMIVSIADCKPGMITAEPIFNNVGAVIIGENLELDKNYIDKLETLNVNYVRVYIETIASMKREQHIENLVDEFDSQSLALKNIIKDISSGKELEFEKVDAIVKSLSNIFINDNDIISCFKIVKDIDEYLYNHCINVALLSALIGKWIGLSHEKINELKYAGLLHDIGKAKVSFKILNKKSGLTIEEKQQLDMHVTHGYKMLQTIPNINNDIELGVLMHHENYDGKGYTMGASGDQIHIYGRIIAIANKYDYYVNLLNRSPFKVFENMRDHTFNQLDPSITLTFLKKVSEYYIGDVFKLNTGEYGEVVSINSNDISRPLIKIDNSFVNLSDESSIKFEEIV